MTYPTSVAPKSRSMSRLSADSRMSHSPTTDWPIKVTFCGDRARSGRCLTRADRAATESTVLFVDRKVSGGRTMAQPIELRKDEPHPMGTLLPGLQLRQGPGKNPSCASTNLCRSNPSSIALPGDISRSQVRISLIIAFLAAVQNFRFFFTTATGPGAYFVYGSVAADTNIFVVQRT